MSLRFIIGRAGTGKTQYCLENIRLALEKEPMGSPIIFLVPEQATFQMEYALAHNYGLGGIIRAQVLSFRRLAWRVLQETGGAARVPIGELGKRMVLRRLLDHHRGELRVFARSADRPGFADALARSIGEMKVYRVGPGDLALAAEKTDETPGLLNAKLQDLALIYREFDAFLAGCYTDPDDYLTLLAEKLDGSSILEGAEVWVDGFTGFTPQEHYVIEKILGKAEKVHVTLCLEPKDTGRELQEQDLFYPTWETFREITDRAQKNGVKIEPPVLLDAAIPFRFQNSDSLAHLERCYFRHPTETAGAGEGIELAAAVNRRAEVEAVARKIVYLCREQNYRWRDIGILLRDLGPYRDLIADVFQDYDIPFFMDCKRNMLHHPLVELIRSAVETVIKDWSYEPLFRCLKTDLLPVSREDADLLENYVLAHGIRGYARWASGPWHYLRQFTLGEDAEPVPEEKAELAAVNRGRLQVVSSLGLFTEKLRQAGNIAEITAAVYTLLEDLHVPEILHKWAREAELAGRLEQAREHLQVWGGITSLFDEMVEAIGEESVSLEDYLAVLEAGLESLRLGLIPPGLDQVVVGTMDRTRSANTRALFILGANEGALPARQADDGIFNDSERERLAEAGVVLAAGGRRKAFDEQYLIYMALTRASEKLWLSFPLADEEGRALTPSPVIRRIKELFPGLNETFYQVDKLPDGTAGGLEYFIHPQRVLADLAVQLRELKAGRAIDPVWWDVYNWFNGSADGRGRLAKVLRGVFHTNTEKRISPEVSRALYGQPLKASVSRIEKFKACPFAHFAGYGLRLKERLLFRLAAPDMGEFFHAALKLFNDRLAERGVDWAQLSREDCGDLATQVVEELAPQLQSEILLSTARYRYLTGKLKRSVNRAAVILAEHARRSIFRPVGVELSFGAGGELPPVTVELAGGGTLHLVGRIDRLDVARTEEADYLRVIDYKSSDNRLSLAEIYYGLRLQLLTYLHVALTHSARLVGRPGLPGAVLYFTVKEPVIRSAGPMSPDQVEKEIMKKLKMQGFLLGDPEVVRMMDNRIETGYSELFPVAINREGNFYATSSVASLEQFTALRCYLEQVFAETGGEILNGVVAVNPYKYKNISACVFCPFKPVCQFDLLLAENRYRALSHLDDNEVWARLLRKGDQ
ncbi:ATP-dependent nuclease subunit B [Thermincola ferriacetica]|uniref:ATP-dependent helicase/deoxyribonuclease subunit B n=1 Tax=Thermincola ferriacetica TaxID=281456 RepID=A0A0L6W1D7_9FIRM|nr:helicase-exonuclease AddAB subunit AddB [Thermincola ferriacetica]KNZ69286.1 ATP-dependent nuclease subunit B [Thermincola ferriacetica]